MNGFMRHSDEPSLINHFSEFPVITIGADPFLVYIIRFLLIEGVKIFMADSAFGPAEVLAFFSLHEFKKLRILPSVIIEWHFFLNPFP
jgi:hypothetical protein